MSVAEHLAEGCSLKATARLAKVHPSVVTRLNRKVGSHAVAFHDERVRDVEVLALEAAKRLAQRQQLVLFTDGEAGYASLFPEIFGHAYRPSRQGDRGRFPNLRYRIPRTLAHVQIVKRREGQRVVAVAIRYAHGSLPCVQRVMEHLGYTTPNTSAIERRNGTARRMNAHHVRRSLAFSRRDDTKVALGWWGLTVYNWSRPHRSLRLPLLQPQGKISSSRVPQRWPSTLPTTSGQFGRFCSLRSSRREVRDNLISLPKNLAILYKN